MTPVEYENPISETDDQLDVDLDVDLEAALNTAEDLAGAVGGLGVDLEDVLNASSHEEAPGDSPVKYDFHRPHHISRPFQDNLQAVADYFAKNGTIEFTSRLRMAVDVKYAGLRQGTYAEFVKELPRPTCAAMVDMPPLKGPSLVQLDLGLCFAFMKKLLGGVPDAEITVRDFTDIERGIASDLVKRFVDMFRRSMSKIVPVESAVSALENNPHYLSGISEGSSLVVLTFTIKLDTVEGPIQWAMPLSSFGPVRDIFDPSDTKDDRNTEELRDDRRKILDLVQTSGSELVVELGQFDTNLETILNLSDGDVLDLPQGVDTPLTVRIAGREAWQGEAGRVGNHRAVKLVRQLTKE